MDCESCHQREATVEYRRNTEGSHQVYQLCERCAANLPEDEDVGPRGSNLLGKLNDEAEQALQAAARRAVSRGSSVILPEDLLTGVLETPCPAEAMLRGLGLSIDEVERHLPAGEAPGSVRMRAKLAPALKLAMELAAQEAQAARQPTVSPGLLLLGLLLEGESAAARLLRDHGARVEVLRERVRDGAESSFFGLPRRSAVTRLPRHLAKYTYDLTAAASAGKLDAVIGRDAEIARLIRILSRRSKNNPVLVGESGVGKTAIVEGLAQRIAAGRVPASLRDKLLLALDLAGMVAGARYRGDFEERLKGLLREIQQLDGRVLLFIDELHTVIGAGTAEGSTLDASHMLKPMLARRDLQCIGATTLEEYRKHVEKDAAFERRFQPILVGEPTVDQTIAILRGLKASHERHHGVTIADEALVAAAELADRYIPDRQLPDKAIDLLDEACATRQLEETPERPAHLPVGADDIAAVVSEWTGVPVRKLLQAEGERLLDMENLIRRRVIGQDEAVRAVSEAVRRARSGLKDPRRPIGSFVFTGPTGVGKTELARALAEFLFQDEDAVVRLDMSEYMDRHSVSRLTGAPPGYAGYEDAGQLTEAVRRKPYSVVLFDEIEKAHPDLFNILLQILDDGRLTDSRGRTVDFKNTVIIMTSNLGAPGADEAPMGWEALCERMLGALREEFRPELLNRIDEMIVFHPLGPEEIARVVGVMLAQTAHKLHAQRMSVAFSEAATRAIAALGYDAANGARPLRRAIQREIENPLSRRLLAGELRTGDAILVDHGPDGFSFTRREARADGRERAEH